MGRPTMTDQPAPLPEDVPRRTLLRWVGWFGVVNGAILTLVGLRYLMAAVLPDSGLAWVYMGLVSVSQFALLSTLPIFLVTLPLVVAAAAAPLGFCAGYSYRSHLAHPTDSRY